MISVTLEFLFYINLGIFGNHPPFSKYKACKLRILRIKLVLDIFVMVAIISPCYAYYSFCLTAVPCRPKLRCLDWKMPWLLA